MTKHSILLLALLVLISCLSARSLMLTAQYNSGVISISHVEVLDTEPQSYDGLGEYAICLKTNAGIQVATRFDFPLLSTTVDDVVLLEQAERTFVVPYPSDASEVSIFDGTGAQVAAKTLASLQNVGDAVGQPPQDSLAAKNGQTSVAQGLESASGKVVEGSGTSTTGTGATGTSADARKNAANKNAGGLCFLPAMLVMLLALASYSCKK